MNQPITLPRTIIRRLEKISANSRHTPQSIIKQAIAEKLDYEEWLLEQVDAGIADVAAGRMFSAEEVKKRLGIMRAKKG